MFTSYVLENVLDNNKKIKRQSKMSYMQVHDKVFQTAIQP